MILYTVFVLEAPPTAALSGLKGQRFSARRPALRPPWSRRGTAVVLRLQYTLCGGGGLSSPPAVLWRRVNVRGFLIRLRSQTGPEAEAAPLCLTLARSLPSFLLSFLLPSLLVSLLSSLLSLPLSTTSLCTPSRTTLTTSMTPCGRPCTRPCLPPWTAWAAWTCGTSTTTPRWGLAACRPRPTDLRALTAASSG